MYWILAILCALLAAVSLVVLPDLQHPSEHQLFDYAGAISVLVGLTLFLALHDRAPCPGDRLRCALLFHRAARPPVSHSGQADVKQVPLRAGLHCTGLVQLWDLAVLPVGVSGDAPPHLAAGSHSANHARLHHGVSRGADDRILAQPGAQALHNDRSLLSFCAGNVILATMPVQQSYWIQAFWSVLIMPFGMDLSFPTATVIMSDLVPRSHQGVAASTIAATVNYSISVGQASRGRWKRTLPLATS